MSYEGGFFCLVFVAGYLYTIVRSNRVERDRDIARQKRLDAVEYESLTQRLTDHMEQNK